MKKTQDTMEPETKTSRPQYRRVAINHWQNCRTMIVEDIQITLEVTLSRCNHCNTCCKRVDDFQRTLAGKPGTEHAWIQREGARWLILPKSKWQDPLDYTQKALELSRIEFV